MNKIFIGARIRNEQDIYGTVVQIKNNMVIIKEDNTQGYEFISLDPNFPNYQKLYYDELEPEEEKIIICNCSEVIYKFPNTYICPKCKIAL